MKRDHRAAALAAILAVLVGANVPGAEAATVSVHLWVRSGDLPTVDARSLPALCYTLSGAGAPSLPAPALRAATGDVLEITLENQDTSPHGFELIGIGGGGSSVPPGTVQTFTFPLSGSGTFLYRDPVAYPENQARGLAGMLEVTSPGANWDGEFGWLLGDHSENWMATLDQGLPVDTSVYDANYFTINGLSGTDTNADPRAHVTGSVGENLLIRVANGGLRLHTLHFHGYHVDIIARNSAVLPAPIRKDTIPIPVGETADLVLRPHQPGVFPIHDHVVLSVAANGVYPLGMIVFTDIAP